MEKKELIYYRLDEVDEKILAMLQDNARVSLKDIGAEVSMSPTAVGTRIDRMLAEGVLEGFTTKLNPEAMGHYIKAFINLEVSPEQKAEFYPYIDSVLNVVECNCVTGDYSMLIEVRFKTTADLGILYHKCLVLHISSYFFLTYLLSIGKSSLQHSTA